MFFDCVNKTEVMLALKKNMNGTMYGWIKNESQEPIHITPKMKAFYVEGKLSQLIFFYGCSILVENDTKKWCMQRTLMRRQREKHDKTECGEVMAHGWMNVGYNNIKNVKHIVSKN